MKLIDSFEAEEVLVKICSKIHPSFTWCKFWECMAEPLPESIGKGWDYNHTWHPMYSDNDAMQIAIEYKAKIDFDEKYVKIGDVTYTFNRDYKAALVRAAFEYLNKKV